MTFGLEQGEDRFVVPILVSSEPIAEPILGFNVIEHLVLEGDVEDHKLLKTCLQSNRLVDISSLVALIKDQARTPDFLAVVRAPGVVRVPAGHRRQLKCVVKERCEGMSKLCTFNPS